MTQPQLTDFQARRIAARKAAHLAGDRAAQWQQTTAHLAPRQETRPPVVIRTGWADAPPPTPAPGFGAGLLTGVIVAGVLALAALAISRMDAGALSFAAGATFALGGVFTAFFFALWIGGNAR